LKVRLTRNKKKKKNCGIGKRVKVAAVYIEGEREYLIDHTTKSNRNEQVVLAAGLFLL
jgi:hypothetical protein